MPLSDSWKSGARPRIFSLEKTFAACHYQKRQQKSLAGHRSKKKEEKEKEKLSNKSN